MNFERFEKKVKRNPIWSVVLTILFIFTTIFSITDIGKRILNLAKDIIGYKEPIVVEANGDGVMEKWLNLAKLQSTKYTIPNSSGAVVKFLTLPMLNHFDNYTIDSDKNISVAVVTTVSPLKTTSDDEVFDGGDCRFVVKASFVEPKKLNARFEINSVSCTDNKGYAYSIESEKSMGYLSELSNPGVSQVTIKDDDGYLTIDPSTNYYAQLYMPLKRIEKRGKSAVGRF